jgi:hypothetical protein
MEEMHVLLLQIVQITEALFIYIRVVAENLSGWGSLSTPWCRWLESGRPVREPSSA